MENAKMLFLLLLWPLYGQKGIPWERVCWLRSMVTSITRLGKITYGLPGQLDR